MSLEEISAATEREFKFSPNLTSPTLNKKRLFQNKNRQLSLFGEKNKITAVILNHRRIVENSFGTQHFSKSYEDYVNLLDALFAYTIGFMMCDPDFLAVNRQALQKYMGTGVYRRLPYAIKNTLVFRLAQSPTAADVAVYLQRAKAVDRALIEELNTLLIQKAKIATLTMQGFMASVLDCWE